MVWTCYPTQTGTVKPLRFTFDPCVLDRFSHGTRRVQGRITEAQLPQAEKSFPGISAVYDAMEDKPATFLQLVWMYEELMLQIDQDDELPRPRRSRN
jgi:hypothetical protein